MLCCVFKIFGGCLQDFPSSGPPLRRTPQNFALFLPSPALHFRAFVSLWRPLGPPGLHTTTQELQTHTFKSRRFQHYQNSTRKPPRERRKNEISGGKEKKKGKISGPPPFRAPTPSGPLSKVPPSPDPHNEPHHRDEENKIGQIRPHQIWPNTTKGGQMWYWPNSVCASGKSLRFLALGPAPVRDQSLAWVVGRPASEINCNVFVGALISLRFLVTFGFQKINLGTVSGGTPFVLLLFFFFLVFPDQNSNGIMNFYNAPVARGTRRDDVGNWHPPRCCEQKKKPNPEKPIAVNGRP